VSAGPPPARPHHRYTEEGRRVREVLTYSRRGNRLSLRQESAWESHRETWVVPEEAVDDAGLRWADRFGREAPLVVEIGSGVGENTVALAARHPEWNVLAFEVWRPGVAETLARAEEDGLTNLRMCMVDAVWTLEHRFAPDSVAELLTFFPDPWPKHRHHKRRLVTPAFARVAAERLRPGAAWRLATDWLEYAERMVEVLDAEPLLDGGVVDRWEHRPLTKFERRGHAEGRGVTDLRYVRRDGGA
jgi:tRNA (guanine-N7-)-methyltransferase